MTEIITKLRMMWTWLWKTKVNRRRLSPPATISPEDYAIIKLKKFNNLPVVIMIDKTNGGITISYDDAHLDAPTKNEIFNEINDIISTEFERIIQDAGRIFI